MKVVTSGFVTSCYRMFGFTHFNRLTPEPSFSFLFTCQPEYARSAIDQYLISICIEYGCFKFIVRVRQIFERYTPSCPLLRAADRYAYRLWKHCLYCRDCLERRDIYILLAFALLRRRRPASPHRQSPCCFTGDHPVDHALPGLTPSTANFPTPITLSERTTLATYTSESCTDIDWRSLRCCVGADFFLVFVDVDRVVKAWWCPKSRIHPGSTSRLSLITQRLSSSLHA